MLRIRVDKKLEAIDLRVDLTLARRVTGLYGPSGSGKTTLLNCIAGLLRPDHGTIAFRDDSKLEQNEHYQSEPRAQDRGPKAASSEQGDNWRERHVLFRNERGGERPIDVPARSRRTGYVFQDGLLFEHMSVERNLHYGRHDGDGPAVRQVVELLELEPILNRSSATLSGGEKRRVALGRALLSGPRILLLDEPLTGLDRRLAGKTLSYIKATLDAFDLPAIYVSHSVSDIIYLCDEVAILDRGQVVAQDAPQALIPALEGIEPQHRPALKNIFSAEVAEVDTASDTIRCVLGNQLLTVLGTTAPNTRRVTLIAPARDIILASQPPNPGTLSARNVLPGKVRRIETVAAHNVVFVDVGTEWMVEVTQQATTELQLKPGAEVFAIVKASSIHCIDTQ